MKEYFDLRVDKRAKAIEIEEEQRRAKEVQECLEKGQSCSYGICDECPILVI